MLKRNIWHVGSIQSILADNNDRNDISGKRDFPFPIETHSIMALLGVILTLLQRFLFSTFPPYCFLFCHSERNSICSWPHRDVRRIHEITSIRHSELPGSKVFDK